MKELAITIGGGTGQPSPFTITAPTGVAGLQGFANVTSIFGSNQSLISQVINLLLMASILLSFIFILIGGLKWITSQGDKKAVEGARNTIVYAIGGMLLSLFAFVIISFLGKLLSVQFFK